MRYISYLVSAAVAFSLPALGQNSAQSTGDAKRGQALAARWCDSCHLQQGQTTATDAAPPFQAVARRAASDPAFIRAFLNQPHAPMPPLNLNQAQIADLMAYLIEQGRR
jgi:mono/diheme cytochrome c family protein